MTKTNHYVQAPWLGCLILIAAAYAPSCTSETADLELGDTSEALTQAEYDCELEKRECLIAADCDVPGRDACESAFHACREPVRDERARVRAQCRAERDACEAAAASEAELHACHIAEHECKLPVDPPEAVCHIEKLHCIWDARSVVPDGGAPHDSHPAEHACHEAERACKEPLRLHRKDLPKAPKCERPCTPPVLVEPPPTPPDGSDRFYCERTKRECLIVAACDDGARVVCESAFRACEAPARAEHKRVHDLCRDERHACEAAAVDEAAHHACHVEAHRCTLPVDPPEAICRVEELECEWAARSAADPSAAKHACHDAKHACVEARRVHPDLPEAPHCAPLPPLCKP